jgi:hypothetical protein
VYHIVQDVVVLEKVGGRAGDGDLVGEAPYYDRRMVVILSYEFLHLADGVLTACRHMSGDVGNFCPKHKALFVTEIVEVLIVLIVSKTDGGSTYLENEVDVLLVMLGEKRVTDAESILVAGYTAQRIFLAVEDEAVVGIYLEASCAESGCNVVDNLAASYKLCLEAVEIGILKTVPEVYVLEVEMYESIGGGKDSYLISFLIEDGVSYLVAALLVGNEYLYLNVSILAVNYGSNLDAGATVVVEIKMGGAYCNEIYITVQTAVEGEVCHLGIYLLVGCVVNYDSNLALVTKAVGEVDSPGGVTAVVMSLVLTVYIYVGRGVSAAYLEVVLISCGELILYELLGVKAGASEIVVAAILTICRIPGVREINDCYAVVVRRGITVLGELPALVERNEMSHLFSSIYIHLL